MLLWLQFSEAKPHQMFRWLQFRDTELRQMLHLLHFSEAMPRQVLHLLQFSEVMSLLEGWLADLQGSFGLSWWAPAQFFFLLLAGDLLGKRPSEGGRYIVYTLNSLSE